jgi:hypothetical protein
MAPFTSPLTGSFKSAKEFVGIDPAPHCEINMVILEDKLFLVPLAQEVPPENWIDIWLPSKAAPLLP